MKKQVWYIAAVVGFVLAIVAASFIYNGWSAHYDPSQDVPSTSTTTSSSTDGRTAPDFTVWDREGNEVRLSDQRGRPVIINFWATWCGYCLSELPHFEEAYRAYGDEVTFMMIDATDTVRETEEVVEAFLEDHGYTFPVYYDTTAEASRAYSAYSIPLTIFIDRDGQVVYTRPGAMSAAQLALYMESYLGIS